MSRVWKRDEKTEHGYVEERLSAYLDGELTQQERGIVERHLVTCQDCRWSLDTLQQTVQWIQELPSIPVPRVFTVPVAAQPARAPRRRWGVPLLQGATALVALMLVFVVAGDFLLTGSWLGLPPVAPGGRGAAPTLAAEADAALQVIVETLQVEVTREVELEVEAETVVEKVVVEEAAPAATAVEAPPSEEPALEAPAAEAPALETPTAEPAEPPAPAAAPSVIVERVLEAKATLEAVAGESPMIVEAQTAIAKAEEAQTATPVPESSGALTPEPTVLPTETIVPPPPEPTLLPTETSAPPPTPTAIPTLMPTPSPELPMAAEAPPAVAEAPREEPQAVGREGVRTEEWVEPAPAAADKEAEAARLPRDPLIVWVGVTEISLAAVLVLLVTITIVVMIRQRRIR